MALNTLKITYPLYSYGFSCGHVWMWKLDCEESWAPKIDAFELWCWRRFLRVPWTARRSNQSILKEISPGCSLEGLMLRLKRQYSGHLMRRADSLEKTLMLGKIEGRRRGRLCSTSQGRRELTGHCGRVPWWAPSPSTQTFKNLSNTFWFKATTPPPFAPSRNSPLCLQSLPEHCLRLKKIQRFF